MSRKIVIDVADLVLVEDLCETGEIPVCRAVAFRYCRGALRPQLAAVKVARQWKTTKAWVREWILAGANSAMRRKAA